MNELALFAGAGGGILGGHLLGWRTVCAVEIEQYQSSILLTRQNEGILPPFPIWDDIRTFDGKPWRGIIDVVSGGFPCQAYSTAARGNNTADDLWPEMRRIVADVAPRYVFAENVSREAIERAAIDCRLMGYKTKAIALSAKDLGADHIRKRYWLLAYSNMHSELLRSIDAETPRMQELQISIWESEPCESRMVDGMAFGMEPLISSGNGQIPIVAATAFNILQERIK